MARSMTPAELRDLESRTKTLHKALSDKAPSATLITMLEGLKKEFRPTEDGLRTTKAGYLVGKLRGHADREVAKVANDVVVKWRKFVEEDKRAKLLSTGPKSQETATPASTASAAAPKTASTSSASGSTGPYKGNPENRKFTTDGANINTTASKTRNNCIGLLYNGLAYRSTEAVDLVLAKAAAVEAAALKAYKGETQAYKEKIRSLFQNLKGRNVDLARNVMSGAISPDDFVVMTSKQLQSAEQREADAALEEENMKKAQVPKAQKSISDTLECSACKKKMVSYSQAQTRSADEPMTTFCECMNCGKRWKFS